MSQFSYRARNKSGELVTGEIEGTSPKAAKVRLFMDGLIPIEVSLKNAAFKMPEFKFLKKQVEARDMMAFTRQFGTLFKAGVPMDRIFNTLSRQIEHKGFKAAIEDIRNDVSTGSTLTNAFSKHPDFFGELYVNMLNVGEESGTLDESLKGLSRILEREETIKKKIKSATMYPKIVITIFFGVLILMMTFVVPKFAEFYGSFNAKLPVPTLILMGLSNAFVDYWYLMIIGFAAVVIVFKKYAATEKGSLKLDELRFKLPVFGDLNQLVANARFGHLAGALYESGVPLVKTLSIVSNAIGNKAYKIEVDAVNEEVQKGSALASALQGKKYFTAVMVESVAVGEQAGSLDEMLSITADFYDEEVTSTLDQLTTLIEPLLLVALFGMVLLLALAIFLPIWKVSGVVLEGG